MLQGIYKVFKRKEELDSTLMFTNNLQIWLAIFAFASFIASYLGQYLYGWWLMLRMPSPFEFTILILGIALVLLFIAMGVFSLFKLLRLLWHAKFGQKVEYDPETIHENFLTVITPIKAGANLKECEIALVRLITARSETKGKVKAEVERRIVEYQAVIDELRVKNGDEHGI